MFALEPVATVHAARQTPEDDHWGGSVARIELAPAIPTDALAGLDAFSDVEIVYVFDRVGPGELTIGSRNAAWLEVEIFAQRGKNRPP